jgi:hypothetical protein
MQLILAEGRAHLKLSRRLKKFRNQVARFQNRATLDFNKTRGGAAW